MPRFNNFEDLDAWKKSRQLAKLIYELSSHGSFSKDFALKDQIRRAAVSVMSNIAEGFDRGGDAEFRHFLAIAAGSLGELRFQLYVALDANFISKTQFDDLSLLARETGQVIGGLMKYLSQSNLKGMKYRQQAPLRS